mmetsp:Transcript_22914/g.57875  ORF Transcript_22914/g.57875 Transcript_22914/m.57875 type:complete len:211 (+) Transcript_22914:165-797(+)
MEGVTAQIDRVEVVDQPIDNGSIIDKGLGVLKSRISLIPQGQHAEYHMRVTRAGNYFVLRKRFSEFAQLHDFLKARFGTALPMDLPSKTIIRHFDQGQLEDRKNALNAYLKGLCSRKDVVECAEVQRFFDPQASSAGAPPVAGIPSAGMPTAEAPTAGGPAAAVPSAGAPAGAGGAYANGASRPAVQRVPQAVAVGERYDSDDDLVGWDK